MTNAPSGVAASSAATESAIAAFEALPRLVDADPDLVRRGRFLTCDFEIGVSGTPLMVSIVNGRVASVTRGPFLLRSATFALRADAETWLKLLKPVPDPGTHDLMALSKVGLARIEGNLQPFMANLQYIKDIVTAPRALM